MTTKTAPPASPVSGLSKEALTDQLGLADSVVDAASLANSVKRFREQGIVLPTFAQLADPASVDP
ncbi:MAG: pyridoxal-5'-phosphate-dependent protein subunit beta, partial [Actinobacteria bacterium]|nr:pyridoxal-5'-phosphate-dependent protein subunit beta [Actinomycetota bacterium]